MNENYLSFDEQFKGILNNEEIHRIKDPELRKIRWEYFLIRHEAFINESDIADDELEEVVNRIDQQENKALRDYIISQILIITNKYNKTKLENRSLEDLKHILYDLISQNILKELEEELEDEDDMEL